jgi:TetR/AcrR family transcriptional repressor of nem operon
MTTDAPTRKGRATHERILAAAAGLMYVHGVAPTSVEDVKAAAGVSSSQLYHYFADRDALVAAVVAYQAERITTLQEQVLAGVTELADLRAWAAGMVRHQATLPVRAGCPIGSLAVELWDRDVRSREALTAGFARWETAIRGSLERLRERGVLREDADVGALATGILAALQGGLLLAQVRDSPEPLAIALGQALDGVAAAAR